ncbi:MAG: hypothetical protein ACK53Y_10185, partial [bacterium]
SKMCVSDLLGHGIQICTINGNHCEFILLLLECRKSHAHWNFSINRNSIITSSTPSCSTCLKEYFSNNFMIPRCSTCLKWDMSTNHNMFKFPPPRHSC